jgi:hypothetical protein
MENCDKDTEHLIMKYLHEINMCDVRRDLLRLFEEGVKNIPVEEVYEIERDVCPLLSHQYVITEHSDEVTVSYIALLSTWFHCVECRASMFQNIFRCRHCQLGRRSFRNWIEV